MSQSDFFNSNEWQQIPAHIRQLVLTFIKYSSSEWQQTPENIRHLVKSFAGILESLNQNQISLTIGEWHQTPYNIQLLSLCLLKTNEINVQRIAHLNAELESLRKSQAEVVNRAIHSPHTPKQVVFISERPTVRVSKIAYGLKNAGWHVILLHQMPLVFAAESKYFDEVLQFNNPLEVLKLAKSYNPVAYHVFASWQFNVAELIIRHKPGKIVYDDYDVLLENYKEGSIHPETLQQERYCLENADALCIRNSAYQTAKHSLRKRKLIYFMEYCWDLKDLHNEYMEHSNKDGFHLVYVGNFSIEKIHGNDGSGMLKFAQKMAQKKIYYHLYPVMWPGKFEDAFSDHLALARETPYFNIHHSLPPEDMVREIAQYDFGLFNAWDFPADTNTTYLPHLIYKCVANKMFDYIDAGLGVLVLKGSFAEWMLKRYGVGIGAYFHEIADVISSHSSDTVKEIRKNAYRARKKLSIDLQIRRLINFYLTL